MNHESVVASCAICKVKTNRRCSRCLSVYYCNKEHQREDWKRHMCVCVPKLTKHPKNPKEERELSSRNTPPNEINNSHDVSNHDINRKSVKPDSHGDQNEGINNFNAQSFTVNLDVSADKKTPVLDNNSVISSVVHADNSLNIESAITYEGSSEQEILSETAQQLTSLGFNTSKTVKTLDTKMTTVIPEPLFRVPHREYPEASIRGSPAPFNHSPNTYIMDSSDPWYNICQRVIRDMTQYGVCVLDNFLTREKGLLVLNEVLNMYQSGIFQAGQLVSNPRTNEARTIRSDRITWIDGKEPNCYHIGTLINQVDNIVLRANKMANNGKMGDYMINGRTKAMVACYPGGGSHYVKHVDNPNKDGRCITTIYYLNLDWDVRRSGGLLRIFPEGTNTVADIEPIFDRMLFFWSDRRNPHEVQPAFNTRYAITLWYFDAQEREEALRLRRPNASQSTSLQ